MTPIYALAILSLISSVALGLPASSNFTQVDSRTGLKYFWYESEKGERVQAFLEGGPDPVAEATLNDVQFYLYTKSNPNTPHELRPNCDSCLENSHFDRNAPVKIICHGFMSDYLSDINIVMRSGYWRLSSNANIIKVNWEKLAEAPWYDTAAGNTRPVGQYLAQFIDYLVSRGYTTYANVHISGHSLGSHVGGHAGSNTASKISRITALDPALPLFGERPDSERIDSTDANFVDVIHTAGGTLGFHEPRGHVDFYPNDGRAYQPGCGIDIIATCSHSRAYEFMSESIWHPNGFPSYKCNSWEEYNSGRCSMTDRAFLGEPASRSARGSYYLRTNQNPPYGQE